MASLVGLPIGPVGSEPALQKTSLNATEVLEEMQRAFGEAGGQLEAEECHELLISLAERAMSPSFVPPTLEKLEDASSWGTIHSLDAITLVSRALSEAATVAPLRAHQPVAEARLDSNPVAAGATSTSPESIRHDCGEASLALNLTAALRDLEEALADQGGQLEADALVALMKKIKARDDEWYGGSGSLWRPLNKDEVDAVASWGGVHALDCQGLLRASWLGGDVC